MPKTQALPTRVGHALGPLGFAQFDICYMETRYRFGHFSKDRSRRLLAVLQIRESPLRKGTLRRSQGVQAIGAIDPSTPPPSLRDDERHVFTSELSIVYIRPVV